MPGSAGVAEWLGTGLQSRLHGFESRHSLVVQVTPDVVRFRLIALLMQLKANSVRFLATGGAKVPR